MPRFLLISLLISSFAASCSESDSGPVATMPAPTPTTEKPKDTSTSPPSEDPDEDSSEKPEEVALISETAARGIVEASCLAAGCHATVDQVWVSTQLQFQVETSLMPPLDQSRYTLSDKKRAELVKYLKSRPED